MVGLVAQLVEQCPFKALVRGSSPRQPTTFAAFNWPNGGPPFNLRHVGLHDRYLFRELLTPLAYCLGGFLVFWIAYFFFTEIGTMQEHKFGLFDAPPNMPPP